MRASIFDRRIRRGPAAALVAGALVLSGCLAALHEAARGPRFDHSHHVKKGLDCTDCHADATTKARPGMPEPASCRECHAEEDTPEVAAVVSEYVLRAPEARHVRPATYADVKIDHARHAAAKLTCAECHAGATSEAVATPGGPMSMAQCIGCHEGATGPKKNDCRSCHELWSRDAKPRGHEHESLWLTAHGARARVAKDNVAVANVERCDLCHAASSCDACHRREAPRDHVQSWRTTTHGLSAAVDRSRCQECHTKDVCDRCHRVEPPRSHGISFGAPRDTHCLSCHEPLSGTGCGVCHKGAPQHQLAAAKPAGHLASMNCRQCHGAGQPLPHVDNGTECNACHH